MEIVDVDAIPVEVPVRSVDEPGGLAPYVASFRLADLPDHLSFEEALARNDDGTTAARKLLVRIETDDGIAGWGEIMTHRGSFRVGQSMIEDVVAPVLQGLDVSDIGALFDAFPRFPHAYYRDITPFLGCVEMAMWDALGKHLGVPVHRLIGGKRQDWVPVSFCLGLLPTAASREKARYAHEAGFDVLKTKGSRYWQADVDRISAMHDAVDGNLEFRLDPNQLWSVDQAVRVAGALEDRGIRLQYLEQPIRIDSVGAMARLRERLTTPIAGGNEDMFVPRNLYQLAKADAIDVAVPDLVPAGGILAAQRQAAVAADANVALAHHTGFDLGLKEAAKLHVMATTPGYELPADSVYYALDDDVLETPLELEDGRMRVPDRPGLAGQVDPAAVETYRVD